MRLFSLLEARQFVSGFNPSTSDLNDSVRVYQQAHLTTNNTELTEGSAEFDKYRRLLLREANRMIIFSASNYRRALCLMYPSAATWCHVTLYYSSWYSAIGLLAMLGGYVYKNKVVDVASAVPGSKKLILRPINGRSSRSELVRNSGSHQKQWEIFYRSIAPILPSLPSGIQTYLRPVSSDDMWLINNRNQHNYDSATNLALALQFNSSFDKSNFPACLSGPLATQYKVADGMLRAAVNIGKQVGLSTDAFSGLTSELSIGGQINDLVYKQKSVNLVRSTSKYELISKA